MKMDDMVLALTSSLLGVERAKWEERLSRVEAELGPGWALRRLAVPDTSSLGARLPDGREVPLAQWREALDAEGPVEARALDLGRLAPAGLPEHLAAAFANSAALALEVRSRGGSTLYGLQTVLSRQWLITPRRFVDFVRLQPHAERVLAALSDTITESQQLNDRPAVAPARVEDFLLSREGAAFLDMHGADLLRAVQTTVRRQRAAVAIPEDFRPFFTTYDPDEWRRDSLPPEQRHEFVPSDEELSLEAEATGRDFVALVEAQPFAREIWERIARDLNQFRAEDAAPHTAESLEALLREDDGDALRELPTGNLMRELQMCCKGHGVEPRIPEPLRPRLRRFGPTPEDFERDPGLIPEREQLHPQNNTERYQVYLFAALPLPAPTASPTPDADVRGDFRSRLEEAEAFATEVDSPFAEAFRLARFVLEAERWRLREYTPEHVGLLLEALEVEGFSERAREVFEGKVSLLTPFQVLESSEARLRGLLACDIADVFGGMGSWNDQGFETEERQARYHQVSERLFSALRAFFLSVVNTP
jgi:hypothetical protein